MSCSVYDLGGWRKLADGTRVHVARSVPSAKPPMTSGGVLRGHVLEWGYVLADRHRRVCVLSQRLPELQRWLSASAPAVFTRWLSCGTESPVIHLFRTPMALVI